MSKKAKAEGRPLVIVESPAKARTIGKFLGGDFVIEASIGHVRDLPKGKKDLPVEFKKEPWGYLGINVNDNFHPIYIVPDTKKEQVKKLKSLLKDASELYLATDEDREGEAISWHLFEILQPKVPVRRLVFHEITKAAIQTALENPREINYPLVHAQETRRIVDRLYGYDVSPLLWRKFGRPGLSAGRVQSVAIRLIVNRERERMAFRDATYWDLSGLFRTNASKETLQATLVEVDGKSLASSRDFDPATGKLKTADLVLLDEPGVNKLAEKIRGKEFKVSKVEEKPFSTRPYPPFTTSTLQQEANRKLHFTARRTMQIAQSLYENGHVSYIRTDSTNLAGEAITAARRLIESNYGKDYLPDAPRTYATKVKNAQEAHEAIRPTGDFPTPQALAKDLNEDQRRLYDLIWKRTVASQMSDARGFRVSVALEGEGTEFTVTGKSIEFPGYLRAYVEGSDDPEADLADQDIVLPRVAVGDALTLEKAEPKKHTTEPPSRFSEPKLTQTLEQLGIGRPSTYASIIETIQERDYVFKKGGALVPTWTAFAVVQLLEGFFPELVDYKFTARMEDDLDAISRGEAGHNEYLQNFYFGDKTDAHPGLKQLVESQIDQIDPRVVGRVFLGKAENGEDVHVRIGKYGPFLESGTRKANLSAQSVPDETTLEKALELLAHAERGDQPLGTHPETNKPVYVKSGRFGPYVQHGESGTEEKPKYASLLKGMTPATVDFPLALKLLGLPREIGMHPELNEPVLACNGRFGPYIKCGKENRSLPAEISPLDVTMDQAVALLKEPKKPRQGFGARRAPLRVLGMSPVTQKEVQLFNGKYGLYVADGKTNASLPRDSEVDGVTLDEALKLLQEREAKGPTKPKGRRGAAPKTPKAAKTPKAKSPRKKKEKAETKPPEAEG